MSTPATTLAKMNWILDNVISTSYKCFVGLGRDNGVDMYIGYVYPSGTYGCMIMLRPSGGGDCLYVCNIYKSKRDFRCIDTTAVQ